MKLSANYPPLQDSKRQEAGNHTGNGQQVAPDTQALVVELQEAQNAVAPWLTNHTVPGQDVALAKLRRHLIVPNSRMKGWKGWQEVEQQQPRRRRKGQRHPGHHGKFDNPVLLCKLKP